jgi:hypothetical protein
MADFSDGSTWMTAFSITHMLLTCVTLGFCNSVGGLFDEKTEVRKSCDAASLKR